MVEVVAEGWTASSLMIAGLKMANGQLAHVSVEEAGVEIIPDNHFYGGWRLEQEAVKKLQQWAGAEAAAAVLLYHEFLHQIIPSNSKSIDEQERQNGSCA
eukprot:gene3094-13108_t